MVLACSALAALVLTLADNATDVGTSAPLRWLVRVPLALIAAEYALRLMRQAANGHRSAGSLEVDNLRFIHGSGLLLLGLLWFVAQWHWGWSLVALVVVPAVLAGYAMELPLPQLMNPVTWVHTYSHLGSCLVAVLLSTSLLIAALQSTVHLAYPSFVRYWLLLNVPAAWVLVLGACVFERRMELEFEPIHDPERAAEKQRIIDRAPLPKFLDELYVYVRNDDRPRIQSLLQGYFSLLDPAAREHDADLVLQRLRAWGEGAGATYVRACLEEAIQPEKGEKGT